MEEALQCFGKMNSEAEYRRCMTEHFGQIPFSQIDYRVVAAWDEYSPELCYLRGMYCYEQQDFAGLRREIERLKAAGLNGYLEQEILLNLQFASPDISLEDWIDMVEAKLPQKFRLYHILGNSHTYLCGVRDLTRMFALTKKEENRRMRIWKAAFGEAEWRSYCFAKMEYYLETLRGDQISQEEWDMLSQERSVPSLCLSFMIQRLLPDKNTGNLREDAEKSIRSNLGQVHER